MEKNIGIIEELDLRTLFSREAEDFTPWLSDNLERLSEQLGVEIIDPEIEKTVGDFRLDIVASDANSRQPVAIENQLTPTDHTHLGQLITYASGIEAGIVIWVSTEIRQEHQQALNWLNENSDTSFFGVEARAIKIGDSSPAIDFRVKVAPNDWSRSVRGDGGSRVISDRNKLYLAFYKELIQQYWSQFSNRRMPKAQPQSWFTFGGGKSGIAFGWSFRHANRFSAEIYIDVAKTPEQNVKYLEQLQDLVPEVPEGLEDLQWEELPGKRACRIVVYRPGEIAAISSNPGMKTEVINWGIEKMRLLEETFRDKIKRLDP